MAQTARRTTRFGDSARITGRLNRLVMGGHDLFACHPTTRISALFLRISLNVVEEPSFFLEKFHELVEGYQNLRIAGVSLLEPRFQLDGKFSRRYMED
ncbi:hypothetical protein EVAR_26692_1 [Eumeta japonica]|uniref:Uncharacterized protein n=1 Tax=Eumeta variegata TaxID=151549 RepID=A0A4C1VN81_EUMVA|nr:hypothetical protein EVAR_26692_1 [Eumeta japonica]